MKKKSGKRVVWIILAAVLVIVVIIIAVNSGRSSDASRVTVTVEKKTIIDKALAVGSIEPVNEIAVKSKISGVVGQLFVNVGDYVEKGQPLLEVKPDPTPQELVQAKRNVEMRKIAVETLNKELNRNKELRDKNLISDYDYEVLEREYEESALNLKIAAEQLELLEKGKVTIADKNIESVINSPITGFILEKAVNVGDPVVPLTSYQAGTEMLKMADMEKLIFKGTVDEIDVGKIREGMPVELQVGALPNADVRGRVSLISLKARRDQNTTVFPVEITIDHLDGKVLRAGFSANASIIIARKDSVPSIPERVVYFRNDSAFVRVPVGEAGSREQYIETGLSDAIQIEVLSGLEEGQEVLEKEITQIR
ncbi:efflux RND transporter periplasmic adaptor subunit [bacterium]|nr:efflux RND transporter periplasmic adaptor subunit [bacterium]